jgi:CheY-like chemotaxis protein
LLIALTGYGQQGDRQRGKDAGFDGHMLKPVDPHALARMIAG